MPDRRLSQALSPAEAADLEALEAIIERSLQGFIEVGNALLAISERRLYRETHPTFDAYCQARWGWGYERAKQLRNAARVVGLLGTRVPTPPNERQARELAPLLRTDPAAVPLAWEKARAHAASLGRTTTADDVRSAADEIMGTTRLPLVPVEGTKGRRLRRLREGHYTYLLSLADDFSRTDAAWAAEEVIRGDGDAWRDPEYADDLRQGARRLRGNRLREAADFLDALAERLERHADRIAARTRLL